MQRIPSIEELSEVVENAARRVAPRSTPCCSTQHAVLPDAAQGIEVSVVTVCFNPLKAGRREVFRKNLDSVQAQEGVSLEHLIIDGASTDGTAQGIPA